MIRKSGTWFFVATDAVRVGAEIMRPKTHDPDPEGRVSAKCEAVFLATNAVRLCAEIMRRKQAAASKEKPPDIRRLFMKWALMREAVSTSGTGRSACPES